MTKLFNNTGRYLTRKQMVYYSIGFWTLVIASICVMNYFKIMQ